MDATPDQMVEALEQNDSGHLVIVTGAGISVASGIPTFRGDDPDAVWKNDVTEKGTYRYFRQDPVASWVWSHELFKSIPSARSNPAHLAVARLEPWQLQRGGRATLITQNVDTLHEQAGSLDVIKVHGTIDRVRCASQRGCENGAPRGSLDVTQFDFDVFMAQPSLDTLPHCPRCGDVIRPHVLWFDEFYADHDDYRWERVQAAAADADLLLFIGTSFAVGVTDMFLHAGLVRAVPIFSVDPAASAPVAGIHALKARAEELLPTICDRLEQLPGS